MHTTGRCRRREPRGVSQPAQYPHGTTAAQAHSSEISRIGFRLLTRQANRGRSSLRRSKVCAAIQLRGLVGRSAYVPDSYAGPKESSRRISMIAVFHPRTRSGRRCEPNQPVFLTNHRSEETCAGAVGVEQMNIGEVSYFGGSGGLPNFAGSIAALARMSVNSIVSWPSSQIPITRNGILTPDTARESE